MGHEQMMTIMGRLAVSIGSCCVRVDSVALRSLMYISLHQLKGPMITAKHRACRIPPLLKSRLRAEVSLAKYDESLYGISGQLLLVSDRNAHILAVRYVVLCENLYGVRPNRCLPFGIVLIEFG